MSLNKVIIWLEIKVHVLQDSNSSSKKKENKCTQEWTIKWEKNFANHISDKGLVARIHKEFNNKNTTLFKNQQRI